MKHAPTLILALIVAFLLFDRFVCNPVPKVTETTTIEEGPIDTSDQKLVGEINPPEIITVSVPQYIYREKEVFRDTGSTKFSIDTFYQEINANKYVDTLGDENITLYYETVVDGKMLSNDFYYNLKIPKTITVTETKTIEKAVPRGGIYATANFGGNASGFNNLAPGLLYINKSGWGGGYEYNAILQTHNLKVVTRIGGKAKK